MPKKKQIKRDEIATDAGLVLNEEQAAMVRKQMYQGSYSLDAPDITVDDDDITVRVGATVYTVYGDSPLHTTYTTSVFRRSGSVHVRGPHINDVESTVRNAIERARDAAEAAIKAVDEEWEANVGGPDDAEGDDADEGLREGPVVGSGPSADVEAAPSLAELKRRKAFAEAVIAECKAAEVSGSGEDWIRIPNAEYSELIAARRSGEKAAARLAAIEEQFPKPFGLFLKSGTVKFRATQEVYDAIDAALPADAFWRLASAAPSAAPLAADDSEVDLEALNAAFADIPAGPYDVIKHSAGWEVRQLDTDPTNGHHWPVRLCQGISGQKAGFDDAAANFLAGVVNAWPLIAARLATTESVEASDMSDAVLDDGGPVEPELDIDALVAAADARRDTCALDIRAVRSAEHPAMTVTASGPGTADLLGQIISNILDERALSAEVTLGVADYRPAEDDVGEFSKTAVDPVDALAAAAIEGAAPFAVSRNGATVSVDGPKVRLTSGGDTFEATAAASVFDELREALASAKNAGGFR